MQYVYDNPMKSETFATGGFSTADAMVPAVVKAPRYEICWNSDVA